MWRPRDARETADLLADFAGRGQRLCLRGAGRSYGDASVLADGDVLELTGLDRIESLDREAGTIDVGAGVTIERLWRAVVPHGWWPQVVPGTMRPTVGGCLAMNVHGKNHYRSGGFGEHVDEIEIALADGTLRRLRPDTDEELFRAFMGGFGLLGVITRARLRLQRLHSGLMDVNALPVASLEEMVAAFEGRAASADHLVGWVDCFDPRGRGVVHAAHDLGPGDDPDPGATLTEAAQDLPERLLGVVPRKHAGALMRPFARPAGLRLVNALKYRMSRLRGEHGFRQSHAAFAFLLDYVPGWKRIYQPGGLIQHQSFVPAEMAVDVHVQQLRLCRERGIVPWLGVYKKHRACGTLMAHALDGYSLALDFPVTAANRAGLWDLCHAMDEIVLGSGGRFYLAKDLTATPESLERAYPGLQRFREIKRDLDPAGVLTSDLARRLRV